MATSPSNAFARNVGAIEVVVLRCRAETDGASTTSQSPPVPNTTAETVAQGPPRSPSSKNQRPSSKTSVKTDSRFGGMMGLFDGANDVPDHTPSEIVDPNRPQIKRYWADWRGKSLRGSSSRRAYVVPKEPLQAIPEAAALDRSHQLQAGRGALYSHRTGSPKYMDTIEKPYAVFWFGYRSKEAIESRLGIKIDADATEIRQQMMHKNKEELVEELIKTMVNTSPETAAGPLSTHEGAQGTQAKQDKVESVKVVGEGRGQGETNGGEAQAWGPQEAENKSTAKAKSQHSVKATSQHPSAANNDAKVSGSNSGNDHAQEGWGSNRGSIKANSKKTSSNKSATKPASDFVKVGSTKGDLDWNKEPEAAVADWANSGAQDNAGWG